MLKEIERCRQIENEPSRRWFTNKDFDLIVWYTNEWTIYGFQLCYDKLTSERAITWIKDKGYTHKKVDTGEMYGRRPDSFTPILISDGVFEVGEVSRRFKKISGKIDSDISEFVLSLLSKYPAD